MVQLAAAAAVAAPLKAERDRAMCCEELSYEARSFSAAGPGAMWHDVPLAIDKLQRAPRADCKLFVVAWQLVG